MRAYASKSSRPFLTSFTSSSPPTTYAPALLPPCVSAAASKRRKTVLTAAYSLACSICASSNANTHTFLSFPVPARHDRTRQHQEGSPFPPHSPFRPLAHSFPPLAHLCLCSACKGFLGNPNIRKTQEPSASTELTVGEHGEGSDLMVGFAGVDVEEHGEINAATKAPVSAYTMRYKQRLPPRQPAPNKQSSAYTI